jgi:hypothetical protein
MRTRAKILLFFIGLNAGLRVRSRSIRLRLGAPSTDWWSEVRIAGLKMSTLSCVYSIEAYGASFSLENGHIAGVEENEWYGHAPCAGDALRAEVTSCRHLPTGV